VADDRKVRPIKIAVSRIVQSSRRLELEDRAYIFFSLTAPSGRARFGSTSTGQGALRTTISAVRSSELLDHFQAGSIIQTAVSYRRPFASRLRPSGFSLA